MDTIPALLTEAARRWGDKPYLVDDGLVVSYARMEAEADRVARGFLALGARKGDRVGIWSPNRWEWVAAAVGLQRIGCVLVPLNTRLRGAEVGAIVRRAGVRFLVSIGMFLDRYYPSMLAAELLPTLERIVVLREEPAGGGREMGWSAFVAAGKAIDPAVLAARAADVSETDIADIMFTSGTTGEPKGAVFDHARSVAGGRIWTRVSVLTQADHVLMFGPFSHNASYKAGFVSAMLVGAAIYWPETFAPEAVYALISTYGITVMPAPPTVFQQLHAHRDFGSWDFSSLRLVGTGGTVVPIDLVHKLMDDFGVKVVMVGYGMTECCGSATSTLPGDGPELLTTTDGCAVDGVEVKIAGADGSEMPCGTAGEVLVRCRQLLIEYLDDPLATAAAVDAQGWLHTGDVGVMNADGYLKITDRLKDMYIVGGFNVYPAEIERRMTGLAGVAECAVIGVADERLGEVGHAFIVRHSTADLSEADVIAWSRENLANYKVPRRISFVDSLPRNASGKVVKFQLKQIA